MPLYYCLKFKRCYISPVSSRSRLWNKVSEMAILTTRSRSPIALQLEIAALRLDLLFFTAFFMCLQCLFNNGGFMETERLYKVLFYVGSGWNFVISITLFLLVSSLPSIIGIEPPRYPLFIYFDLMSIFFFGCIQWIIARNLYAHRSFVKMLVWAKLAMGAVLLYSIFLDAPPKALTGFLAPGVVLDVIFGLIFLRFLIFSRSKIAV